MRVPYPFAVLLFGAGILGAQQARAALPFDGYADLVEHVNPTVVTVLVTSERGSPTFALEQSPFGPDSPFEEFFRRFGVPTPNRDQPLHALGSGFVLDSAGYIVTNNHVVDQATSIHVRLNDDTELEAEVVGTDPRTDLALLKIDPPKSLPHVTLGDSDKVRVGEAVVAVGNPFGLGDTVTSGIISARGRDLDTGPYVDYFQTDAAINRGNSGGPLFNTRGEVVGVNSQIFSPNGGSVGVGFAIPSNVVRDVTTQLRTHGNVTRGWLGVLIQPVTDDIAEATGVKEKKGALVAQVTEKSPASGVLEPGDVITAFDGRPVDTVRDLPKLVAGTPAGQSVTVDFLRAGHAKSAKVTIEELPDEEAMVAGRTDNRGRSGLVSDRLGVTIAPLTDQARRQLNLDDTTQGVVITSMKRDGAAAAAGLRVGDVIERIGNTAVTSTADVEQALAATKTKNALLLVSRGGNPQFVGVPLS